LKRVANESDQKKSYNGLAKLLPCDEDPNEDKDDRIPHHFSAAKRQNIVNPP